MNKLNCTFVPILMQTQCTIVNCTLVPAHECDSYSWTHILVQLFVLTCFWDCTWTCSDVHDPFCAGICTYLTNKCDIKIRSSYRYFHLFGSTVVVGLNSKNVSTELNDFQPEIALSLPQHLSPEKRVQSDSIQYLQRHDWPSWRRLIVRGSSRKPERWGCPRGRSRRWNGEPLL